MRSIGVLPEQATWMFSVCRAGGMYAKTECVFNLDGTAVFTDNSAGDFGGTKGKRNEAFINHVWQDV